MENVNLTINGIEVSVPEGSTILEAARVAHIEIPTLCFLKDINEIAACRICVVEVEGAKTLVTACVYPVSEGMKVHTNSAKIRDSRRKTLQLLLSIHDKKCLSCFRSGSCELQKLCNDYNIDDPDYYDGERNAFEIDRSAPHMIRDNNKCILCRRCVGTCNNVQGIGVIGANERGFRTYIGSQFNKGLGHTSCISCGQCITSCPTGALRERDDTQAVFDVLADPTKRVIVQTAPAVRAALGEEFGFPIGTDVEGKMVAALRRLGFDDVFDTDFGADLTIMEEAAELIDRMQNGGVLPMMTSCSPGWISYCEHYFPDLIPNLSSCKSPHTMFGAILKSYYAEKIGVDKHDVVVVSVMPCTAKKVEIMRDDENGAGVPDVDYVLTTREIAVMIKQSAICFRELDDEPFDEPLGIASGAGVIFGATGGVMEAALRTAYEKITGQGLEELDFKEVRGMKHLKEAEYDLNGQKLKVAVVSSTKAAHDLLGIVKLSV